VIRKAGIVRFREQTGVSFGAQRKARPQQRLALRSGGAMGYVVLLLLHYNMLND